MSDVLSRRIDDMIRRAEDPNLSDDIRFSITLTKITNMRLEAIRKRLKLTKQELIQNILTAAITDIEVKLELLKHDEDAETGREFFKFTDEYMDELGI